MGLQLRRMELHEIELAAQMNHQLIEDEGSHNPMNLEQLKLRIEQLLGLNWNIDLLWMDETIVGYALYQFRLDQLENERTDVYLRQYFIVREERNKGYGLEGIKLLREQRFHTAQMINLDVLETNPKGRAFWEKAGFSAYYTNMKMENKL